MFKLSSWLTQVSSSSLQQAEPGEELGEFQGLRRKPKRLFGSLVKLPHMFHLQVDQLDEEEGLAENVDEELAWNGKPVLSADQEDELSIEEVSQLQEWPPRAS